MKYLRPEEALADIRILRALTEPVADVKRRAKRLAAILHRALPEELDIKLVPGVSMAGGGSLPTREIPTLLVGLRAASLSAATLEERLRRRELPVIVRVADDQVLLDVRTVDPEEFADIRDALKAILTERKT
jgi:L-seryl-tRNA(Ser) seleniumtransferase